MRLIDADVLEKLIREEGVLGDGYSDDERERDICMMIDDAPTIDAEPVRHGRWISKDTNSDYSSCSLCRGSGYYCNSYCPRCGAKMDAKEDKPDE